MARGFAAEPVLDHPRRAVGIRKCDVIWFDQ
jgi:hypothetical protein